MNYLKLGNIGSYVVRSRFKNDNGVLAGMMLGK